MPHSLHVLSVLEATFLATTTHQMRAKPRLPFVLSIFQRDTSSGRSKDVRCSQALLSESGDLHSHHPGHHTLQEHELSKQETKHKWRATFPIFTPHQNDIVNACDCGVRHRVLGSFSHTGATWQHWLSPQTTCPAPNIPLDLTSRSMKCSDDKVQLADPWCLPDSSRWLNNEDGLQ